MPWDGTEMRSCQRYRLKRWQWSGWTITVIGFPARAVRRTRNNRVSAARMALLAELPTEEGSMTVVSTHLESNANAEHRHRQFAILLDAIDDFATAGPVVIGGDLNTGNHMPPDFDWRKETLFSLAEDRGYSWEFTADGMTTRPSLITPHPDRQMKLDWIAGRGLRGIECGVRTSLSETGHPLSDHDLVWATVAAE